jgi:DNA-binding NtrC family response regulator
VIAANNKLLSDHEATSEFRPDLYYRLSEYSIFVPTLRSRPEDIEFLASRFLRETQVALNRPAIDIAPAALDCLRGYQWPGNVRQLRNVIRRAGLLASHEVTADHVQSCLPARPTQVAVRAPEAATAEVPLRDQVEQRVRQVERDAISRAMAQTAGNKTAAARLLGIDCKTFRVKLKAIKQPVPANRELFDA